MWMFCLYLVVGVACGFRLTIYPFFGVCLFVFVILIGRAAAAGEPFLFDACMAAFFLQTGYFIAVLIHVFWRYRVRRGNGSDG